MQNSYKTIKQLQQGFVIISINYDLDCSFTIWLNVVGKKLRLNNDLRKQSSRTCAVIYALRHSTLL